MLLFATLAMAASWQTQPVCPTSFSYTTTTIGAVSNSAQMTLCVSNSVLIKGTNGSVTLVIGGPKTSAPRCLVYPNGLNPDLSYSLLDSGHIGCWSLYPPSQPVAIVNIGKASNLKIATALKSFKPQVPRIFTKPAKSIFLGQIVLLHSNATVQIVKTKLLNLPAKIRFTPVSFQWGVAPTGGVKSFFSSIKPTYQTRTEGIVRVSLVTRFSTEYLFDGLTGWLPVKPNLIANSASVNFLVQDKSPPQLVNRQPRLVDSPCSLGSKAWGC